MSVWSSIKHAVKKAAKAVAHAVTTATNAAAEAVSDVVETIGSSVQDGVNWVARQAGKIPGVGRVLGPALRWVGRVVSGATALVGGVVKGALGLVGGVVGGVVLVLGGILTGDGDMIGGGFKSIVSSIAGAIVLIGGQLISLVQTIIPIEQSRPLTDAERFLLKRVFRKSVALYNVRLVIGHAGLFGLNDRPFTLGDKIYMKDTDPAKEPEVLVHECTHVWQFQHWGAHYASDAIGAQWFVDDAYSWEKELDRGHMHWVDFNKEAEAQLFQDIFTDGELITSGIATGPGGGVFYDADGAKSLGRFVFSGVDRTDLANESVTYVRGAFPARFSALWS